MKKMTLKSLTTFIFLCAFALTSSLCINSDALAKISKSEARKIALQHAGVAKDRANFDKVDYDKGRHGGVYEVTFHTPNRNFQYTISADRGKILNHSVQNRPHRGR